MGKLSFQLEVRSAIKITITPLGKSGRGGGGPTFLAARGGEGKKRGLEKNEYVRGVFN